jgi:hypothetical protein
MISPRGPNFHSHDSLWDCHEKSVYSTKSRGAHVDIRVKSSVPLLYKQGYISLDVLTDGNGCVAEIKL